MSMMMILLTITVTTIMKVTMTTVTTMRCLPSSTGVFGDEAMQDH